MKRTALFMFFLAAAVFMFCNIPAASAAERGSIAVSSDDEGKAVAVTIAKDNWTIDCRLDAEGRMTGFYIGMKDVKEEGDRVSLSVYFVERKKHSVLYNYYRTGDNYSVTFFRESAMGKKMLALAGKLIEKLYTAYNLAELAKKEAVKKQAEYRRFLKDEMNRAAERAKKRPNPVDIIKDIIKTQ